MTSELLLDDGKINELKDMLEDGFDELFLVFKENSRIYIDHLKEANVQMNVEDMLKYAHILKGSCGSLGLTAIYNTMVNLENSLANDDSDNINALINKLDLTYSATLSALVENDILAE